MKERHHNRHVPVNPRRPHSIPSISIAAWQAARSTSQETRTIPVIACYPDHAIRMYRPRFRAEMSRVQHRPAQSPQPTQCDRIGRKDLAVAVSVSIAVALVIAFARHNTSAWARVHSVDLTVYWCSFKLFLSTSNPYDAHSMLLEQQKLSPVATGNMAWNPPLIFVLLGPFFWMSIDRVRVLWSFVTTLCAILTAFLTFELAGKRPRSALWIFLPITFCPFLYEMSVEQISSYLTLIFVISLILFRRGRFGWAGALAGFLAVKPHMFYLPLLWCFAVTLLRKRWYFALGFLGSVSIASALTEVVHPGIHSQWISRENWPTQYVGSTLSSLARAVVSPGISSGVLQLLFPALAGIILLAAVVKCADVSRLDKYMMLSILLCPITAPYGFVFDQVVLIVPVIAIFAIAASPEVSVVRRRVIVVGLVLTYVTLLTFAAVQICGFALGWYAAPPMILALWALTGFPSMPFSDPGPAKCSI